MATRLIGTDDADPRLPALVVAATQGTTAADLAPGNIGAKSTWSSPISGGITIGSGSVAALKASVGDIMHCWFFFQFGAGSAITTSVDLALPSEASSASFIHGIARLLDASAATDHTAQVYGQSTTAARIEVLNASATYLALNNLSATIPFTWATGDTIAAYLTYPAASS